MRVGKCRSHHRSHGNYWAWQVGKIKVIWSLNQLRARVGRWWHGKEERARATSSVQFTHDQRLRSLPPLLRSSGRERPLVRPHCCDPSPSSDWSDRAQRRIVSRSGDLTYIIRMAQRRSGVTEPSRLFAAKILLRDTIFVP